MCLSPTGILTEKGPGNPGEASNDDAEPPASAPAAARTGDGLEELATGSSSDRERNLELLARRERGRSGIAE